MANGGMTTGISSIPLKYQIFPDGVVAPDLIIASFGYNDLQMMLAKHKNPVLYDMTASQQEAYLLHETQRFVRAAVSKCDSEESSPAILLLDDSFMIPQTDIRTNLMHSRVVNEVASWYDIGGVSWTKAMMHLSYAAPALASLKSNDDDIAYWPLWGGNVRTSHPNIVFHVGIAWLLFYQFVLQLSTLPPYCGDDGTMMPVFKRAMTTQHHIPSLDESLYYQDIAVAWSDAERKCASRNTSTSNSCSYLWIVNRATNVQTKEDVRQKMNLILEDNRGWMEEGFPILKPRPGWVAQHAKATFRVRVNATAAGISKLTVIYLKSYGSKWKDATLSTTVRVRDSTTNATKGGKQRMGELQGYHDSNTSVNYEADFFLQTPAAVGDHVVVTFKLEAGSTFRINGLMFCNY